MYCQSSILSMERRLLDSGAILAKEEDVKELLEGLVRMEKGPLTLKNALFSHFGGGHARKQF